MDSIQYHIGGKINSEKRTACGDATVKRLFATPSLLKEGILAANKFAVNPKSRKDDHQQTRVGELRSSSRYRSPNLATERKNTAQHNSIVNSLPFDN
jgi:hypothetical protein